MKLTSNENYPDVKKLDKIMSQCGYKRFGHGFDYERVYGDGEVVSIEDKLYFGMLGSQFPESVAEAVDLIYNRGYNQGVYDKIQQIKKSLEYEENKNENKKFLR